MKIKNTFTLVLLNNNTLFLGKNAQKGLKLYQYIAATLKQRGSVSGNYMKR